MDFVPKMFGFCTESVRFVLKILEFAQDQEDCARRGCENFDPVEGLLRLSTYTASLAFTVNDELCIKNDEFCIIYDRFLCKTHRRA